ncbi:hypothetical protein GCM10007880_14120 [Mesorhizobium amorphae]|uniref:Acetyl-CoA acetyltransferase n=1 Tax=Mesorhizobium amorphae CCNWGS0123 TaxID=1082933 RepID=G6YK47_9HYPH|nr:acetyl-CoA acetyltransferase [Mesorhizobium amorphae CCNWGS0123]GLR40896.1 hypothetical protein GCM10007880_14120 [Mesorhizobium amorphae]
MDAVYIVAAKRTPIGKLNGALASLSAAELGGQLIHAMLAESGLASDAVSEVIMGQVLTGGAGQNPARQTSVRAGLPVSVPAMRSTRCAAPARNRSILPRRPFAAATPIASSPADRTR